MNLSQLAGSRVYLDANIFIYAFEAENRWTDVLRSFFRLVESGRIEAVTSELTLAEVLVKPLMIADDEMVERYLHILAPESALDLVPVSREVLQRAARIRAQSRLRLLDAIHAASAEGCRFLLSNDNTVGASSAIGLPLGELSVD